MSDLGPAPTEAATLALPAIAVAPPGAVAQPDDQLVIGRTSRAEVHRLLGPPHHQTARRRPGQLEDTYHHFRDVGDSDYISITYHEDVVTTVYASGRAVADTAVVNAAAPTPTREPPRKRERTLQLSWEERDSRVDEQTSASRAPSWTGPSFVAEVPGSLSPAATNGQHAPITPDQFVVELSAPSSAEIVIGRTTRSEMHGALGSPERSCDGHDKWWFRRPSDGVKCLRSDDLWVFYHQEVVTEVWHSGRGARVVCHDGPTDSTGLRVSWTDNGSDDARLTSAAMPRHSAAAVEGEMPIAPVRPVVACRCHLRDGYSPPPSNDVFARLYGDVADSRAELERLLGPPVCSSCHWESYHDAEYWFAAASGLCRVGFGLCYRPADEDDPETLLGSTLMLRGPAAISRAAAAGSEASDEEPCTCVHRDAFGPVPPDTVFGSILRGEVTHRAQVEELLGEPSYARCGTCPGHDVEYLFEADGTTLPMAITFSYAESGAVVNVTAYASPRRAISAPPGELS